MISGPNVLLDLRYAIEDLAEGKSMAALGRIFVLKDAIERRGLQEYCIVPAAPGKACTACGRSLPPNWTCDLCYGCQ